MFPTKTFSDFYKEAYVGGAFRILRWSSWSYNMSRPDHVDGSFVQSITDSAYQVIPFIKQDKLLGWKIPFLRDWLAHPQNDLYWERSSVGDHYTDIRTSVYNVGGWFDSFQQGTLDNFMRMRIFVMGQNVWRHENEWPLARTAYQKYYFHSSGNTNTLGGDGTIDIEVPKNENPDIFVYDPENPVITPGRDEPIDQREVEAREDVLVYSTGLLKESLEVTGPVEVVLYASSSAINTDFTAKLVDVYPDGKAIRLCEGIIRASFRNPEAPPSAIQPNKIYKYNVSLWSTSNLFKEGHQIRVEISSSNFPRFDRNLNTGIYPALDTTFEKAMQTIYHSKEYPSCIVLPVIK